MNEPKTVSLVYRVNGDFSDELVFTSNVLPDAKRKAELYCKRNGVKIISKRDNFSYPATNTRDSVTWLVSPFNFSI